MKSNGREIVDLDTNLEVKPPSDVTRGVAGFLNLKKIFGGRNRKIISKVLSVFLFIMIISALFVPQGVEAKTVCEWLGIEQNSFFIPGCLALKAIENGRAFIDNPIGSLTDWTLGNIFSQLTQLLFIIANIIFFIASGLFDSAIVFTLSNGILNMSGVETGWSVTRDVTNLFFIFILLGISIATILRIESYGAKQLLVKLIIVALLINFSLPLTRVIIDASNVLALQFVAGINNSTTCVIEKTGEPNRPCSIQERINKIIKIPTILSAEGLKEAVPSSETPSFPESTYTKIGIVYLGGSLVLIVTSFVFFAFTILFLLRTILLAFVLILAPLGFLAMILPATKQHATEWWRTLLHQSFFAPAALFMLYISLEILTSPNFIMWDNADQVSNFASAVQGSGNLGIIFNFTLVIGLLITSLVVAQKLGAVGASTAIAWGKSGYKMGAGYVGRKAATRAGGLMQRGAAGMQRQPENSRVPGGVWRTMAKGLSFGGRLGAQERAKEKENYGKLSDDALKGKMAALKPDTPQHKKLEDELKLREAQKRVKKDKTDEKLEEIVKEEKAIKQLSPDISAALDSTRTQKDGEKTYLQDLSKLVNILSKFGDSVEDVEKKLRDMDINIPLAETLAETTMGDRVILDTYLSSSTERKALEAGAARLAANKSQKGSTLQQAGGTTSGSPKGGGTPTWPSTYHG